MEIVLVAKPKPNIKAGDTLRLDGEAGILYKIRPLTVVVIEVLPWEPYWEGTLWIRAYEIDTATSLSVGKRDLYVIESGVKYVPDGMVPLRHSRRSARR